VDEKEYDFEAYEWPWVKTDVRGTCHCLVCVCVCVCVYIRNKNKCMYGGHTVRQFETGWPLGHASRTALYEAAQVIDMLTKIKVNIT